MRLLELREEKNLTQDDVAKGIDTTRTNIGRWEKGINEPAARYLIALADFFECSIDYLLDRTDNFGNVTPKKESSSSLTIEEQKLLDDFRLLPREEQKQSAEYVHYLAHRHGAQNKNA